MNNEQTDYARNVHLARRYIAQNGGHMDDYVTQFMNTHHLHLHDVVEVDSRENVTPFHSPDTDDVDWGRCAICGEGADD